MSQIAAERVAGRTRVNDAATESSAKHDTEEDVHGMDDDMDDVEHDEKKETENSKMKKAKKSEQQLSGHFSDSGDMHLLT